MIVRDRVETGTPGATALSDAPRTREPLELLKATRGGASWVGRVVGGRMTMKIVPAPTRAPHRSRRTILPRGRADLVRQIALWLGFAAAYQIVRGLANRGAGPALANGDSLLRFERRLGAMFELRLQRALLDLSGVITAVNWTYWLAQFVVVGLAISWIYLRRYPAYLFVRDTMIVTNTVGLIGYLLLPVAPPRLLVGAGFVDTLSTAGSAPLSHGNAIVGLAENPYAAMPSLHTADALIVGVALAFLVRPLWLKALCVLWPAWVTFSLIVTGNHFWADVAAGLALVALTVPLTFALERLRPPLGGSRQAGKFSLTRLLGRTVPARTSH
jgi:membrane-associated phospholipid phosphatase